MSEMRGHYNCSAYKNEIKTQMYQFSCTEILIKSVKVNLHQVFINYLCFLNRNEVKVTLALIFVRQTERI